MVPVRAVPEVFAILVKLLNLGLTYGSSMALNGLSIISSLQGQLKSFSRS